MRVSYSITAYVNVTDEMLDKITSSSFNCWATGDGSACTDYEYLTDAVENDDDMDKDLKKLLKEVIKKVEKQTQPIGDVVFNN